MKLIAIYALREPDTGEIRYIGKATDAMARFKSHMRDARRRSTPVYVWINELAAAGKKPVMDVLRMVEPSQWEAAEREEIACRDRKRLLNIAAGGNQPSCPVDVCRKNAKNINARLKGTLSLLRTFATAASDSERKGDHDRAEAFRELSKLVSTAPSPYKERFEELGRRRFYG